MPDVVNDRDQNIRIMQKDPKIISNVRTPGSPDVNTLELFEKELIKSAMNKPLLESKAEYSSALQ